MTDQHPITPPPELLDQWLAEWASNDEVTGPQVEYVATQAARWGADQELEACCADIHTIHGQHRADWLRWMRRPKTPSLKEQALKALQDQIDTAFMLSPEAEERADLIRRALEQLDD